MTYVGTGAMILIFLSIFSVVAVVISSFVLWLRHKKELKMEEDRITLVAEA